MRVPAHASILDPQENFGTKEQSDLEQELLEVVDGDVQEVRVRAEVAGRRLHAAGAEALDVLPGPAPDVQLVDPREAHTLLHDSDLRPQQPKLYGGAQPTGAGPHNHAALSFQTTSATRRTRILWPPNSIVKHLPQLLGLPVSAQQHTDLLVGELPQSALFVLPRRGHLKPSRLSTTASFNRSNRQVKEAGKGSVGKANVISCPERLEQCCRLILHVCVGYAGL
mmetsp:Transcript_8009/g.22674  ORF Transcript_8009/g.22674 Transcript_8009/m.22674 type:complete len:224 (-) Transcript_8009:784-1455(-)